MRAFALLVLLSASAYAPAQQLLQQQLRDLAAESHGHLSVSCSLPGTPLDCDLDPHAHAPMQSVFKLPLVLTVLHEVEQGRFTLDQQIRFRKSDLILPKPYSPLQDMYPQADIDVPLHRLLEWTVGLSDNTAADLLLRIVGGPKVVSDYMDSLGVRGFHLLDSERALHRDTALQYRNWFEPAGAVQLLRLLVDRPPLNPEHSALLLGWMTPGTPTRRIQAGLAARVAVPHKSGTSDTEKGIAAATNDIALIPLLRHRNLALAVFLTDSTDDDAARDRIIARVADAVYNAAVTR